MGIFQRPLYTVSIDEVFGGNRLPSWCTSISRLARPAMAPGVWDLWRVRRTDTYVEILA